MNNQPDMFTPEKQRRNTDPRTSHDAAATIETLTSKHKRIIAEVLRVHPAGLTPEEVSRRCVLDFAQVWRRMSDLKRDGIITPTGEERLNTSGRKADVMRLTR